MWVPARARRLNGAKWFASPARCKLLSHSMASQEELLNATLAKALESSEIVCQFIRLLDPVTRRKVHNLTRPPRPSGRTPADETEATVARVFPKVPAAKRRKLETASRKFQSKSELSPWHYGDVSLANHLDATPHNSSLIRRLERTFGRQEDSRVSKHCRILQNRFQLILTREAWRELLSTAKPELNTVTGYFETENQAAQRVYEKATQKPATVIDQAYHHAEKLFAVVRQTGLSGLAMLGDETTEL